MTCHRKQARHHHKFTEENMQFLMHSILGQRQARTQAATFLLPEAPDVHQREHIVEHHLRVAQTCQRAMHRARTKKKMTCRSNLTCWNRNISHMYSAQAWIAMRTRCKADERLPSQRQCTDNGNTAGKHRASARLPRNPQQMQTHCQHSKA